MRKKISRRDDDFQEDDDTEPVFQLDLEGFSPSQKDSEGISLLSQQLFPVGGTVSAKQLADYIVSHQSVGTVVKPTACSDDDDDNDDGPEVVFAFTSVIDLGAQECTRFVIVRSLRDWLIQLVSSANPGCAKESVLALLESREGGNSRPFLFLNERFENIPLSTCAQAVTSLPAEMKTAGVMPTHIFMVSRASRENSIQYAYPEVEFIRPFALFDLELPNRQASAESDDCFDTFILNVINMDHFGDVLEALETHV